jgi:hypothetical protein
MSVIDSPKKGGQHKEELLILLTGRSAKELAYRTPYSHEERKAK